MQFMSARDAKNTFGKLVDIARAEPVIVEKHGRPVIVAVSVKEYERLTNLEIERTPKSNKVVSS